VHDDVAFFTATVDREGGQHHDAGGILVAGLGSQQIARSEMVCHEVHLQHRC
jgi:hypothetical protein